MPEPTDGIRSLRWDRRHSVVELVRLLARPRVGLPEIAAAIRRVPGLDDALRHQANASLRGLPNTISTLEHAVVFLGLGRVRQWLEEHYGTSVIAELMESSATDHSAAWSWRESA